jgi:hypothetical protein
VIPPWQQWAERLQREQPELIREWFTLADAAWALGIRRTSSDLLLHQCRARLRRSVLNHTSTVLARMHLARFPERGDLFVLRPSILDGPRPPEDPRQPELFGEAA